jgi:hypothetical protein
MDFLDEYSQTYHDEITTFISKEFDFKISRSIMSRILKRIRIIYKRIKPVHGAQNEDLRVKWMNIICNYSVDHLVFLDETVYCGRIINRR